MLKLKKMFAFSDHKLVLVFKVFAIVSIVFGLYLFFVEDLRVIDIIYYLVTTATTVGYGDISPTTDIGKMFSIIYMLISISALGVTIGAIGEKLIDIGNKKNKGSITLKNEVELIIVGYPTERKVKDLVFNLFKNEKFKDKQIVLISDILEEKPEWFKECNIVFVKGLGSDKETLHRANIMSAKKILILANDANDIRSDDFSSSTLSIVEDLHPEILSIVEKVREDETLFTTAHADIITPVASAAILSQEILNEGAIAFARSIFDNSVDGTQFNVKYIGESKNWEELAISFIKKGRIPEGYKNPNMEKFDFMPKSDSIIQDCAIIKYRGLN